MIIGKTKLSQSDPIVAELIRKETEREEFGLEMIPSENFVSEAVLEANGSVLTNKYAEGLPHKRYYGGCEVVDGVEELAIKRAQELFGCEFVNAQPHSGAQANQAAYEALLSPGDVVMGMRLDQGGHLTHGSPVNFSGKHYKVVAYGVRKSDQQIDPDEVRALALEHRPKMIVCGASAYSRKIDFAMFRKVADEIGAVVLADIAHYAGLVAVGEYPSPVPVCQLVSTTTHKTLRGPRSGLIMGKKEFAKVINRAVFPGLQGGPHMHTIAAKAVALGEALKPEFKDYIKQVVRNAKTLAETLISKGLKIVSGGTDSHLMVIDLSEVGVTGKDAEAALTEIGITVNKNTIPFDTQPPTICSGIRLGTPALTSRGMKEPEMKTIGDLIVRAIDQRTNTAAHSGLRDEVLGLTKRFPLYLHRLK